MVDARTIGKYQLVDLIGKGGMGEVWKAKDTALDRVVAVKLLQRTHAEDLARFRREAHAVAQVMHPNIAQLYEFSENPPFIVMQYVDGVGLDKFTPSESTEQVLRARVTALRDAARAVTEAHARGIFHRDLKPDNILVDAAGRAFVLDFGLAREARSDLTAMSLTGDILGTPSYMAPEQARGQIHEMDARTDVYGLGATLYAVLAGRPPHVGPTAYAVIQDVVNNDPPAPAGDAELSAIAMKAIEKERDKRYGSAAAFADDLERWLKGEPVLAKPPTWTQKMIKRVKRNPVPYALTGVIALIALGLAAYFGGGAIVRAARIAEALSAGEEALSAGDADAALGHAQSGLLLAPDDLALARLRDRALSVQQVGEARQALGDRGAIDARLAEAGTALSEAERDVAKFAPATVKAEQLWPRQDAVAGIQAELRGVISRVEQSAHAALRYDRDNTEARRLLAELYFEQWEQAVADRDATEAARLRDLVVDYGGSDLLAAAEAPVSVMLAVTPPDAEAYLFVYEERDRRLIPVPWGDRGQATAASIRCRWTHRKKSAAESAKGRRIRCSRVTIGWSSRSNCRRGRTWCFCAGKAVRIRAFRSRWRGAPPWMRR